MAANAKEIKGKYRTPGVIDGNLARRYDQQELERRLERSGQLDFDQQYKRRQVSRAEQIARQRAKTKAAARPVQRVAPAMMLGFAAVACMLVCLLMCYIRINAISNSIVDMKSEITRLETEQVTLLTRHEQAFDLATVKEAARAAGMRQPSESQIYYIDLPGQDQVTVRGGVETSPVRQAAAAVQQKLDGVLAYFR